MARALREIDYYGDWELFRPSVWAGEDSGTEGWQTAPQELGVRGWAYNVWNITNTQEANYVFELEGEVWLHDGGTYRVL